MEQRLKVHSLKLLTDKDGWKLVILSSILRYRLSQYSLFAMAPWANRRRTYENPEGEQNIEEIQY